MARVSIIAVGRSVRATLPQGSHPTAGDAGGLRMPAQDGRSTGWTTRPRFSPQETGPRRGLLGVRLRHRNRSRICGCVRVRVRAHVRVRVSPDSAVHRPMPCLPASVA